MTATLTARQLGVTVGGTGILSEVDIDVLGGELLALVGPNGAGKSTLLGVLSGDIAATEGSVELKGRDIRSRSHLERARLRSVLAQENAVSFPFTVLEVIEMGRAPWARTPSAIDDERAIQDAIDATDISHLLERRYPSLSGGEKARVSLARVLAQDAGIVLLDEPTAALDLRHQEDTMRVARRLADGGRSVVVVLHDLSLAGAYADRIALLAQGRLRAIGTPADILTREHIAAVYGLDVEILHRDGKPVVLPSR